jgi:hypothetical protein
VSACSGELERTPRTFLAAHVAQVGHGGRRSITGDILRRGRVAFATEVLDRFDEVVDGDRHDPRQRDLRARLGCAHEPFEPAAPRALGGGECAGDRSQAAVESELADRRVPCEALRRQLAGRTEERKRDRQVEAGPFLAEVGRRKVDRDAPDRPLELGRGDSATDAVLRLLARAVGEPDDRKAGHASLEMRFDLDTARLEADEGMRDSAREHVANLDGNESAVCTSFVTLRG